jgi:error-prone DNA polymerase
MLSPRACSHGARLRRVKVGGFVIARQKPGTAKGITFLLLKDEGGTLNVIVPAKLYEAQPLIVRTEPLILIEGVLERHASGGARSTCWRRRSGD